MVRLDKWLSEAGVASRRELKKLIRSGAVQVNGVTAKDPEQPVAEGAEIMVHGTAVEPRRTVVLMLHKPAGFVTSTDDPRDETVMSLLPEKFRAWGVTPVGRLDKDTEGLLLFTNDGDLAHRLISPRSEVRKVYYAEHEGRCDEADVQAFREGLTLRDGTVCRPAELTPLGEGKSRVTLTEGKYHQVRRMLASRGHPVCYLRREEEGGLRLGALPKGGYRELSAEEIAFLRGGSV